MSRSLEMERDKSQWDTASVNEAVQLMLDIVLHSGDTFNVRVESCQSFAKAFRVSCAESHTL